MESCRSFPPLIILATFLNPYFLTISFLQYSTSSSLDIILFHQHICIFQIFPMYEQV